MSKTSVLLLNKIRKKFSTEKEVKEKESTCGGKQNNTEEKLILLAIA